MEWESLAITSPTPNRCTTKLSDSDIWPSGVHPQAVDKSSVQARISEFNSRESVPYKSEKYEVFRLVQLFITAKDTLPVSYRHIMTTWTENNSHDFVTVSWWCSGSASDS